MAQINNRDPVNGDQYGDSSTGLSTTTPNIGIMYNLRQFFSGKSGGVFWWFPTISREKYEGYYYPQAGLPREKLVTSCSVQNTVVVAGLKLFTNNLETLLEYAERLYSGNTMIYYSDIAKIDETIG